MKNFSGDILFLDRADINTDEIIPARYLTESSRKALQPYLFEDLNLTGFDAPRDIPGKGVIVGRANFGCGSSREHAVWALEENGIDLVIAESFARIFRENMFNCGMMAVELPSPAVRNLVALFSDRKTHLETDLDRGRFIVTAGDLREEIPFSISDFELDLVRAGGWVEYADQRY